MAHPMDESNPKRQDKVNHRTHTIPDRIPSEHDNAKHMINRMGGIHSDCTRQTNAYDTFDYRTLLGWT
jgi:hypothetical protein